MTLHEDEIEVRCPRCGDTHRIPKDSNTKFCSNICRREQEYIRAEREHLKARMKLQDQRENRRSQ